MLYWLASLLLVIPLLKLFDRFLRSYDSIPGPPRWPIVGNLAQFMGVGAVEIFAQLADYSNRYGGIYKLDFLYDYTIVYSSPEAAELILKSSNFTSKSEDYQKVAEWIGDGLLLSRGYKWLTHRRVIAPGFNSKVLERFVPVFSQHAETFCSKLEALMTARPDESINVLSELKLHALGVLCETAMGVTSGEEQEKQRSYTQAVEELNSILYWRMFDTFGNINALFRLTPTSRRFNELVATSRSFTHDMIDRRRKMKEKLEKASSSNDETADEACERRKHTEPLMDTLLQARIDGKALTDEEIREEVDTFTFAGHDTAASAMTFLLYNVAKYPDVQERLYEEIISQIGAEFSDLSMSTLNDLQYMDRVIKESLRLYPPVPVVARTATNDMMLLGQHLKRGTTVALNIFSMHRNEEYFPDPCRFSPERFEGDDDYLIYDRYAYIPFSTGPRYCIGKKFAQYELKCTLVKILQRFQLRLTSVDYVPTLKAEIVLKPVEGMPLIFKSRK